MDRGTSKGDASKAPSRRVPRVEVQDSEISEATLRSTATEHHEEIVRRILTFFRPMNLTPRYYAKTKQGPTRGPFADLDEAIAFAQYAISGDASEEVAVFGVSEIAVRAAEQEGAVPRDRAEQLVRLARDARAGGGD